jgi:Cell division protein
MKVRTVGYTVKQGLKSIGRNKMFSLASIATMAACIFLFGLFLAIVMNFSYILKAAEEGVSITVLFDDGTPEERILEVEKQVANFPEVLRTNYVSAEQAWDTWKVLYFQGADEKLMEGFEDDNPLANSANLEIYVLDIEEQRNVVAAISAIDGVRRVNHSEIVASRFAHVNRLVLYISATIIGILLAVSIFLISNTVTIGISVRREEIGIMKLIGATDFFVRAPFIIEGIIIGAIGAFLPLLLLYVLYNRVVSYVLNRFSLLIGIIRFIPSEEIFSTLFPIAMGLGIGIGFLGSSITVRKHLRV